MKGIWFGVVAIILTGCNLFGQSEKPKTGEYIKVEVLGKLNSQVFAIGGETTGVEITANGITWELEFGDRRPLRNRAKKLNGQKVIITGYLVQKSSVERKHRRIVKVEGLREAGVSKTDNKKNAQFLDEKGKLKHELVFDESQSGFAGVSGIRLTISQDGSWRLQKFLNERIDNPIRVGKLSTVGIANVADQLASAKFNELPDQIGKAPDVNPRVFSIKFGNKSTKLMMTGGGELPANPMNIKNAQIQRFVILANALQGLAKSEKKSVRPGKS